MRYLLADGFTFTIQNVGPGALGGDGGSLGYSRIGKVWQSSSTFTKMRAIPQTTRPAFLSMGKSRLGQVH